MKSVIICEGNTDLLLIQYFLEKAYEWDYIDRSDYKSYGEGLLKAIKPKNDRDMKWLKDKNGNVLCLISSGGVSGIPQMLHRILEVNDLGSIVPFDKIVIISDRDEAETEPEFSIKVTNEFSNFKISFEEPLLHNKWNKTQYINQIKNKYFLECLFLIIPFEDTGAIETFLLDALCASNAEDKVVIEQCRHFIDNIDCKGKYLKARREKTKAKFDTTFVVMTPAEAFEQRRTLLRSVPWEKYELVQNSFKELSKLSDSN